MTNNGTMYTTVMEKLNFEPRLNASDITVSIKGNEDIVVLSGKVRHFMEKIIAEETIKKLHNIKIIVNDIVVDLTAQYKKTDVEIATDVSRTIKSSVYTYLKDIKIVVKDGVVFLTGEVTWNFQKKHIFNIIKSSICCIIRMLAT